MGIHLRTEHEQHIVVGSLFAVLASISFTIMSLLIKLIGDGASAATVLFARFLVSLIIILPLVLKHRKTTLRIVQPIRVLLRTVVTLLSVATFFYILKFLDLTNALVLNNTSPLFVPVLVWIAYQKKTSIPIWIGVIVGFIGIIFVLKPNVLLFQPIAIIGLSSGLLSATAYVMIRSLTKTIPILQILFYNFLICTLISGLFLPLYWHPLEPMTILLLLSIGLFGAIYHFFNTVSIATAPIRFTSSLQLLSIVFGAVLDFLIWNKIPDFYSLIGIALVMGGGVMAIYFGQKQLGTEK